MSQRLKIASGRDIVSDSHLTPRLLNDFGCCCDLTLPQQGLTLSAADIGQIVERWRATIERGATRLTKYASSNLDDLPTGCIYEHLAEPEWRVAAQVCEVFRNPSVSKNAGSLDTSGLQAIVHSALSRADGLTFVIGWGQPKRDAGGLKTLGAMADLAEMYAIARLAMIRGAARRITGRPVRLEVLTGGSRFYDALFTRPALTKAYDAQRQQIADALCGPDVIAFRPYADATGQGGDLEREERRERLALTLATIDEAVIATKFSTILLNIDWGNILTPDGDVARPHGIALPKGVREWLSRHDEDECRRLVRAAIVCITSPKCLSAWIPVLGDEEVLDETIAFVQQVTWESTRTYVALHMMDAHDEALRLIAKEDVAAIRLTVHEKRDRREIPAILTLGLQGGNLLSQHVMARVGGPCSISFETFVELQRMPVEPVRLARLGGSLFGWLAEADQPLCFVGNDVVDPIQSLARALTEHEA